MGDERRMMGLARRTVEKFFGVARAFSLRMSVERSGRIREAGLPRKRRPV